VSSAAQSGGQGVAAAGLLQCEADGAAALAARGRVGNERGRRWCRRVVRIVQRLGGIAVKAEGMMDTVAVELRGQQQGRRDGDWGHDGR
jgi:hypothetical protein